VGGILVNFGAFTGVYKIKCRDSDKRCVIMVTCLGAGLGLGGALSGEGIRIWGANDASQLSGEALGGVAFGGLGPSAKVGPGGSGSGLPVPFPQTEAQRNPNKSVSGGFGIGAGGGTAYKNRQIQACLCCK
jgi:hypothetical protein